MNVFDTHCHASELYFEPIELLVAQMDRNDVPHAALIQIRGQYDNRYQEECIRRFPGRFCSVVIVDARRPDGPSALEVWASRGAVGVRLRVDDPDPIWRQAATLGLTVSAQGGAEAFASERFARLVADYPKLPIVMEHYAGLHHLGGRPGLDEAVVRKVLALAKHPNVYVKVHGLGEFAERAIPMAPDYPFVRPIPDVLERVAAAFGADKMMWGSDYPPCSMREGYRNALRLPMATLERRYSQDQLARIFGENARTVFPISASA